MAGEIEEPVIISFQTDSLHSGSISFGRFEHETLCWERRSSFSHNRYLEEVEKCSKPGLVVEKKAYFEAHFKRKAHQLQEQSECQNARVYNSGENDMLENQGYRDEYDNDSNHFDRCGEVSLENMDYGEEFDSGNDGSRNYHFDENVSKYGNRIVGFDYENEGSQSDYAYENNQFNHFDGSPEGSKCQGEHEPSVLLAESHLGVASDNANVVVHIVPGDVSHEETHDTGSECSKPRLGNDEPEIDLRSNLNGDAVDVDESSKLMDLSPKSEIAGKVGLEHQQIQSPKSRVPAASKSTKPRLNSQFNISHVPKHSSCDAPKTAARNLNRREKESSGRMKAEKQPLKTSIPVRLSSQRSPKTKDSECSPAKSKMENKSEKELRARKVSESQPSTSKKTDPRTCPTNRLKQTVDSNKPTAGSSAVTFSFRIDERAEKRKELCMKLAEKMNAKETRMNQIQAKTQEKTEAEIKQFRKSLNFKATPMPSFYHAAALPGSDRNRAPAKIEHKSTSPGTQGSATSPLLSKIGDGRELCVSEPADTIDKPESSVASKLSSSELSEGVAVSSSPPTQRSNYHKTIMKTRATGRKELEKKKSHSLQKYRVSESSKMRKDHTDNGKPKVGTRRNSIEIVRKSMKGISIGTSSGMGRLAVGVAS